MNKLVSFPIAAAMPTVAPVFLNPAPAAAADNDVLLKLADQFITAVRRYGDALVARDALGDRRPELPEVLRIRPRDLELGRKPWETDDEFWHRPCDMTQWRQLTEYKCEMEETEERVVMTTQKIPPSAELSARAAEILAAYQAWYDTPKPRGYKKAQREARRAEREYFKLERVVAETPATTIEGMLAKIRCAEADEGVRLDNIDRGSCAEAMAISIFEDIRRMSEARPAA